MYEIIIWIIVILLFIVCICLLIYIQYQTQLKVYGYKWITISNEEWNEWMSRYRVKNTTLNDRITIHSNRSRCCVVCYDDRKDEKFEIMRTRTQRYCNTLDYDFKYYEKYDANVPPYWIKIKIIYDIMMTNEYDYVMWIDSDACVHNYIAIPDIFKLGDENTFIVMAPDLPNSGLGSGREFNAGVWILKNNDIGKEFIADWLDLFETKLYKYWKRNGKKWTCHRYGIPCLWAGVSYEQGSGVHLMTDSKYQQGVLQLPYQAMQDIISNIYAFTLHFMGDKKEQILLL
jgi:hypothetical protein